MHFGVAELGCYGTDCVLPCSSVAPSVKR